MERRERLGRLEGILESSGRVWSVRLEDVKAPSETDWPSRRRLPTGAAKLVVEESFSFSLSPSAPEADFPGGDMIERAVPEMAVGGSEAAVRSDWEEDVGSGSCPVEV